MSVGNFGRVGDQVAGIPVVALGPGSIDKHEIIVIVFATFIFAMRYDPTSLDVSTD